MITFVWGSSLWSVACGTFTLELALRRFRVEALAWELLFLRTFAWELGLRNIRSGTFAWAFGFGSLAWELWLRSFALGSQDGDLGLGTGILKLGESLGQGAGEIWPGVSQALAFKTPY